MWRIQFAHSQHTHRSVAKCVIAIRLGRSDDTRAVRPFTQGAELVSSARLRSHSAYSLSEVSTFF